MLYSVAKLVTRGIHPTQRAEKLFDNRTASRKASTCRGFGSGSAKRSNLVPCLDPLWSCAAKDFASRRSLLKGSDSLLSDCRDTFEGAFFSFVAVVLISTVHAVTVIWQEQSSWGFGRTSETSEPQNGWSFLFNSLSSSNLMVVARYCLGRSCAIHGI